jgi:hypothetical protein
MQICKYQQRKADVTYGEPRDSSDIWGHISAS